MKKSNFKKRVKDIDLYKTSRKRAKRPVAVNDDIEQLPSATGSLPAPSVKVSLASIEFDKCLAILNKLQQAFKEYE